MYWVLVDKVKGSVV